LPLATSPSHHRAAPTLAKAVRRDAPQNHCPEAAALEPNTLTPDQPRYRLVVTADDPHAPLHVRRKRETCRRSQHHGLCPHAHAGGVSDDGNQRREEEAVALGFSIGGDGRRQARGEFTRLGPGKKKKENFTSRPLHQLGRHHVLKYK
jgi:hypothetical protein